MGNVASTLRNLLAFFVTLWEGNTDSPAKKEATVVFIGPPSSGKTTLAQRLCLESRADTADLSSHTQKVYRHLVKIAQKIHEWLEARKVFSMVEYTAYGSRLKRALQSINSRFIDKEAIILSQGFVESLYDVYHHTSVHNILQGQHEQAGLIGSDTYFLDNILRITEVGYVPTLRDIVHIYSPPKNDAELGNEHLYMDIGETRVRFQEVAVTGENGSLLTALRGVKPVHNVFCIPMDTVYCDKVLLSNLLDSWNKVVEETRFNGGHISIVFTHIKAFNETLVDMPLSAVYPTSRAQHEYELGPLEAAKFIASFFNIRELGVSSCHFLDANCLRYSIQPLLDALHQSIEEL